MKRRAGLLAVLAAMLASTACASHGYVVRGAPPPPPPYAGYVGRAPGPRYVWMEGYWARRGNHWAWVPGRWVVPPRGRAAWVPGRWTPRHGGHVWIEGYWR